MKIKKLHLKKYKRFSNINLDKIDFEQVRGGDGRKEATVNIAGNDIKVVAASGIANAQKILEEILKKLFTKRYVCDIMI